MAWFPEGDFIRIIERETPQVVHAYTTVGGIASYTADISPAPPGWLMSVSAGASGVFLTFPLLDFIFPIEYVDYVTADEEEIRVATWAEVPESGVRIVSYRANQVITAYSFTLTVTAIPSVGSPTVNVWQIDINNDWRVERLIFLERLNAST